MDYLQSFKKFDFDDKLGFFLYVLSILILLIFIFTAINQSIWIDEVYSLNIVKNSFSVMIDTTAGDVHPPLYYAILKSVLKLFSVLGISFSEIIVGKFVSLIPLILLLIFSTIKLRRELGWLVTGIFSIAIVTMPQMMAYGIEIRMYSWAMFFVTMSFFYAYTITKYNIDSNNTKKLNKKRLLNWGLLTIFAVLGAYTHYFVVISIAVVYFMLLVWLFFKNKKEIKFYLISVIMCILLYLPWIFIVIDQFTRFGGTLWWIPPITLERILNQVMYIVAPSDGIIYSILGAVLFVSILLFLIYYFVKNRSSENIFLYFGVLVFVGTLLIIVIESLLVKPSLVSRYLIPSLGCFWLGFSIILSQIRITHSKIFYALLIIFLIIGGVNAESFISSQHQKEISHNEYISILGDISKKDLIIHNNFFTQQLTGRYFFKNSININFDNNILERYNKGVLVKEEVNTTEKIEKYLDNNKTVWLFYDEREDTLDELNIALSENGFGMEEVLDLTNSSASYPNIVFKIYKINILS